jgi:hypothetical protein
MSDEAANGFAGAPDARGHSGGGKGEPAPLQSRAKFLENWNWASVTQINRGLCERGGAQHGINSEAHAATAEEWETFRSTELTLLGTFQFLKSAIAAPPSFSSTVIHSRKSDERSPTRCSLNFPFIVATNLLRPRRISLREFSRRS